MDDKSFQMRLARALEPYTDLLIPFAREEMSPEDFERAFLKRYLSDEADIDDDVFDVFDGFFGDVEEFVADPRLRRPERGELGPEELLASTRELLERAGMR